MSLDDRVAALSPAKRALLQKRLAISPGNDGGHIPTIARGDRILASSSQERMWLFQQMYPEAVPYNSQVALHFTGPLDVPALERSLNEIVRRHEIYRTSFQEIDGTLRQQIHDAPARIDRVDLSHLPLADAETRGRQVIEEEIARPFRLDALPLVRWTLIRLGPQRHILLCRDHHAVTDGWSRNVVFRELMALYSGLVSTGRQPELPAPRLQFADFAAWQHRWLTGADGRAQIDYWTHTLAGSPATIDLPYDRPHPARPSFRGGHELMRIGHDELRPLRDIAAAAQATMFMTMLSVFLVMLHRYCGADDVCVGSGIANRRLPETDGLIGMLINTVVLRVDLSGHPTFRTLLERVRLLTLEAYANQEAPFEKVVEAVAPARRPGINPLHQVTFNFQNNPMPAMSFPGLETRLERPLFNGSAKFDLYVAGWPRSEARRGAWQRDDSDVLLSWEYSTDVFDAETVRQMQAHFHNLLSEAGAHPDRQIADLRMDDVEERARIESWAGASTPEASTPSVHALFEAQVQRAPDQTAVVSGEARLTYRELDQRANRVADALRELGVGRDALVGVCLERSLEAIVSLLGVLKAGGAYVPLDPGYPVKRLASLVSICGPRAIVTSRALAGRVPKSAARTVIVEDVVAGRGAPAAPSAEGDGEALAYVLFTSGSTGEPRAVAVPHRAVARLVHHASFAQLDARQTWLHLSPLSFDASTLEVWGPLCNGGRLVLMPAGAYSIDDIARTIEQQGVTSAWLAAGLFQLVASDRIETFAGLEQLLTGGDVVPIGAARKVLDRFPALRIINGYGPTENTTFTSCHAVTAADLARPRLPIGRAISGTTIHILDAHGEPCPIGIAGELCAGGLGLARGYWNDPGATAEKFVAHPRYGRLYHTGDRGRFLPDGAIEFLGRMDRQVKIRGHRIELGEIEAALRTCPGVGEVVVDVRGASAADKTIAAYVVPRSSDVRLSIDDLRAALRSQLPEYAQPTSYALLESIPLTPNGKVDRDRLAQAAVASAAAGRPAVPRTPLEEVVSDIWKEVLELDAVGIHDDFFVSGGHSLAALRVLSLIKARSGIRLETLDFFQQPTIAGLAARAEKRRLDPEYAVARSDGFIVELRGHGRGSPLFILPGGWGDADEILVFAGLLRHLSIDRPIYAVRSRAMDSSRPVPERLDQQARDVLHAIDRVHPGGPFVIVGECAASSLALTLGACAEAAGDRVEAIVLLDPGPLSHLQSFTRRAARLSDGAGPMPELRSMVRRVATSWGAYATVSAWRANLRRLAASASPTGAPARPRGLPRRVAKYYRMLGSWEPQPLRSPLHLVLSTNFPDLEAVRESWTPLARGPLSVHQAPGDHASYIRDQAPQTARLLEAILAGRPES